MTVKSTTVLANRMGVLLDKAGLSLQSIEVLVSLGRKKGGRRGGTEGRLLCIGQQHGKNKMPVFSKFFKTK